MPRQKMLLALTLMLFQATGCTGKAEFCRGITSAEGVANAGPAIAAFKDHLKKYNGGSELDSFFGEFANYDLAITTSEASFEYQFIPQNQGKNYKGGGASYSVSRKTGRIIRTVYMK